MDRKDPPTKVLIVGLDGVCRTAMVTVCLKHALRSWKRTGIVVESAAVNLETDGQPAKDLAVRSMSQLFRRGLESHRSQYIGHLPNLPSFDRIYCVDKSVQAIIQGSTWPIRGEINVINGDIKAPHRQDIPAYRLCAGAASLAARDIARSICDWPQPPSTK